MRNSRGKFANFLAVFYILLLSFFMKCSDDLADSSAVAAGLGPVKILLTDIELPTPTGNHPEYHSICNGDKEHDKDCSEFMRMTKAIIVNLQKIEIYSTANGWTEAINLVTPARPEGAFFELLGLKQSPSPELGIFQLPEGDYSAVRFYFGERNYVIAQDTTGKMGTYELEIETEQDDESNNQNNRLKSSSPGYRTGSSGDSTNHHSSEANKSDNDEEDEHAEDHFIELQVPAGFFVDPESMMEITIGVDPAASLRPKNKNKYHLVPIMNVANIANTTGASKLISAAAGGSISLSSEVTIDIPPGALNQDTWVAIVPKQKPTSGDYRPEFIDLKNYVFLPHGLTMNADATLTMKYNPEFISDLNNASGNEMFSDHFIDIQYFDEAQQRYRSVGREIDFENHTATAKINHFSDWLTALITAGNIGVHILNGAAYGNPVYSAGLSLLTWQTRVNDILRAGGDWNTTRVERGSQLPITDGAGNVSFDKIRSKDGSGKFEYYAYKINSGGNPKFVIDVLTGKRKVYTITDVTNPAYAPFRPKFIPEVEDLITKNAAEYTPGYPMNPALFMISQFADIVMNPNLTGRDNKDNPSHISQNPIPFLLTTEVDGYASVNGLSMLYSDITLGSYLFFHAAQRHDLCDGRGGMYEKTYNMCNLDFYGDKDNPEPFQYGSDGKPVYPARYPSFYNMASICKKIRDPLTKDRCWMARENFMIAVSYKVDHAPAGVCDDYELRYVDNPSTPPTENERKKMCIVKKCETTPAKGEICTEVSYNMCIPEATPDMVTTCEITGPDIKAMMDYLSTHGHGQFAGVPLVNGQLPPIPAESLNVEKVCPIGHPAYLNLSWGLNSAWSSMPNDFPHIYYDQVHIYLNRANINGTPSGVWADFIFRLALGNLVSPPVPETISADRKVPFYYERFPRPLAPYPGATRGELLLLMSEYLDTLDPLPSEPEIRGFGNYTFTFKAAVTGEIQIPGYTYASPYELASEPVSIDWCNHEVLNLCVDPWWHRSSCPVD